MRAKFLSIMALAILLALPAEILPNSIRPGQPRPVEIDENAPAVNSASDNQAPREDAVAKSDGDSSRVGDELKLPASSGGQFEPSDDSGNVIMALGNIREDANGTPLVIPTDTEDLSFLEGQWDFERYLLGRDNERLAADLNFNKQGRGTMTFTGRDNKRYTADIDSSLSDGVLRMRTSRFVNEDGRGVYSPEFIECRNGKAGAECAGTDGFSSWSGERLFADRRNDANRETQGDAAGAEASTSADGQDSAVAKAADSGYVELSAAGAEVPPAVMEKAEKASVGKNGLDLGVLEGDWRYSQDFARESDGSSAGLEFHFDKNGKGYSTITDGKGRTAKAEAESILMPNGVIRVKTDAYSGANGAKEYYPTFMECSGKAGQDLNCAVSNSWMRAEGGKLLSINSYKKNMEGMEMEELLPTASETSENSSADSGDMSDIFAAVTPPMAETGRKTAGEGKNGGASAENTATRGKMLELPGRGESVSFMQGDWLCKTGLVNASENKPVVVLFSFNKAGKGSGTIRETSGKLYRSSAQASYRKGILRINTSQYVAVKGGGAYEKSSIECRDDNGKALCVGKNGGITWKATFLRQN